MTRSVLLLAVLAVLLLGGVSGQSCNSTYWSFPSARLEGFDLRHLAAPTAAACQAACCAAGLACQAFTYTAATTTDASCIAGSSCCYLKYQWQQTSMANVSAGTVSGYVEMPQLYDYLYDWEVNLQVLPPSTGKFVDPNTLYNQVLLDMAVNMLNATNNAANISASVVVQYLRIDHFTTTEGGFGDFTYLTFAFYIMSPITAVTGVTPQQYAANLSTQLTAGVFASPYANATLTPNQQVSTNPSQFTSFPASATPGQPVFDSQISLQYQVYAYPAHMNVTLWRQEIAMDLAVNAAFLCNLPNPTALLPFISIQAPALNFNPADLQLSVASTQDDVDPIDHFYSLTFTISAHVTTVTGPYWTPDRLQLGFQYLDLQDNAWLGLFIPFTYSNLSLPGTSTADNDTPQYNNLPTPGSSTGAVSGACQADYDELVTFQALLASSNATSATSPAAYLQLLREDIAFLIATQSGQPEMASVFLSYVVLVSPVVATNSSVSVVQAYTPAGALIQPLSPANKNVWFNVQFTLLNTISCVAGSNLGNAYGEQMSAWFLLKAYAFDPNPSGSLGYLLPNTQIEVGYDEAHSADWNATNSLPICAPTATLPSCSYQGVVNTTADSTLVTFVVSLQYPITAVADFNEKLVTDVVGNFALLGKNNASDLIPYVNLTAINSAVMGHTVVQFEILGAVSALDLSAIVVAETFVAQAAAGKLSLPLVAFWYGATAAAQRASAALITTAQGSVGFDSSSSGAASPSAPVSFYPAGSEAIVFYVLLSASIPNQALFAIEMQEDIAINLANITGQSATTLLPYVVVTSINGTAVLNTGSRRLLQADGGAHTSISFVLLGSVSALSTSSTPISAAALTASFGRKAQDGQLQTPTTGASAPAQTVSSNTVGGASSSSSTGYGATNGAAGGKAVSVCTLLAAMIAAMALLL